MSKIASKPLLLALNTAPLLLFLVVLTVFGTLSPRFLTGANLLNVLVQSSSTATVALGMTFVLLTAGVDLSVGAVMFVGAAVAGKLVLGGAPFGLALALMLLIGIGLGALNGLLVTRLNMVAFIVTLAMLYLGRGFALWLTETRAMNLPPAFLDLGTKRVLGIPVPVLCLAFFTGVAHVVLARTPFGRQVYAVGADVERAAKAGINIRCVIATVYVISGFCAAAGGILALAQLGTVSPTFGANKEFAAIAAAVLGGTSLFGGRGSVPGTLLGAVFIQCLENGLVILNADVYFYPLITSAVIFLAVFTDSLRTTLLARLNRRQIRIEERQV
jgi:ribose transport system permease protein